ncbi:MAG: alpha/beta hydrolase [Anaerolineales bacterium]
MNPPRNTGTMDSDKFKNNLDLISWTVDGFKLLSVNPPNSNNKQVIFLHGGAYLLEATAFHQKFMETLAKEYGLTITFIDYPKGPEHTFRTTHDVVLKAYLEILHKNPGNEFYLVGDSAGGGLGLALLQELRDKRITPFPKKTVLVSPWLDLTMSNESIQDYESKDHLLPVKGLIYAAKLYSGGEDLRNPLLSPLYGDMSNLGVIKLFFGTNEVLYPDCLELTKKISSSQGSSIEYIIGENMMHDWIIFPFKESKKGVSQIAQFLISD